MSDEQPWERQEDEDNEWYDRFFRFLQLGPSRSIRAAYHQETPKDAKGRQDSGISKHWYEKSKEWNWVKRAEAWDDYRRKQVFTTGNAYDLMRVEKLNKYSERVEQELDKMFDKLAKKKTGKAWFNQFLYEKYLQTLEALAQETGGRVKKQDITTGGEKLEGPHVIFYMPDVTPEEGYDG